MHHRNRIQRRRNHNVPGHAHELTFTCFRRYQFLAAERCCVWLSDAIDKSKQKWDFAVWAFVFMPEHAHLIVWPRQPVHEMRKILQSIKQPVGQRAVTYLKSNSPEWLPRITHRRGGSTEQLFWQSGGGYDRNIDAPKTLWAMIDYIHMNPGRRGLVARAADWKWSSAGWFEGMPTEAPAPDRIPPDWGLTS
jgi:putative transposase